MTTWDEYNRRRAAIKAVLDFADANPSAGLPFEELPEVAASFADRRELLVALQYDWSQALWSRLELLAVTSSESDASELAHAAWLQCAKQHSTLRRLLDGHREEFGSSTFRGREPRNVPFVA